MKTKLKSMIPDTLLSLLGIGAFTAVQSLLVYPFLERNVGASGQGGILFYTSIALFVSSALGSGINYGRMKILSNEHETENGEYNRMLIILLVLTIPTVFLFSFLKKSNEGATYTGLIVLTFLTAVRVYADVEFRISLNYRGMLIYYLLIGLGEVFGMLLYKLTGSWVLIFITGESFALIYVIIRGKIFRPFSLKKGGKYINHIKTVGAVSCSFVFSDFVSCADRLLLPILLINGDEMSSFYYYASLVGKITSLVSTPLNGVISGYISRDDGKISLKTFLKIIGYMMMVFVLFTAVSVLGSCVFVGLFYRDYYEKVKGLFIIANAGQVIFFICNTLMIIVLRYLHEKYQFIIGAFYLASFFIVTVPLILKFGVYGMAYGILFVNVLKFILFTLIGIYRIKKESYEVAK